MNSSIDVKGKTGCFVAVPRSSPVTNYYGEKTGRGLIRIAQTAVMRELRWPSPTHRSIPCSYIGELSYRLRDAQA